MAMPEVFGADIITALNRLEGRLKVDIITDWEEKLKSLKEIGY
jgi:hypothetical protein